MLWPAGVLSGVRVLDLTRLFPGAYCSLVLADMGAEVIKVESPRDGDYLRFTPPLNGEQGAVFDALNRGKRSVAIDLKDPDGVAAFKRLALSADAVLEGNRPGVMDRLGLGWDALHELKASLVLCSITGYGAGELAQRAGHDLNYMALSGALSLNARPGEPPLPFPVQFADFAAGGMGAALNVVAALLAAARTGEGRHVVISMADVARSWLLPQMAQAEVDQRPPAAGREMLTGLYPCYRVYACADGRHVSVAALEPKFWTALCEALNRPELVPRQFDSEPAAHAALEAVFAEHTRAEWESALAGLDVCVEPVLEVDEAATRFPHSRADLSQRGPHLGEHTEEVLEET